jgi:hypothetical protein
VWLSAAGDEQRCETARTVLPYPQTLRGAHEPHSILPKFSTTYDTTKKSWTSLAQHIARGVGELMLVRCRNLDSIDGGSGRLVDVHVRRQAGAVSVDE